MASIPLPKGISGIKNFPKLKEYYINMMPFEGGAICTPGLTDFASCASVCRGAVTWMQDELRYQVSGTVLERVLANGTVENLGTIEGTEDVFFSQGQVELVIGVKGGKGYSYHFQTGLSEITDVDYLPSVDADFIDGRHVFIPADGSPAFYSEVDAASNIDGLAFFDAEELPDKNKCTINTSNQLYIGGTDAFEVFRTNIDPDTVFTRRDGGRVDVGFVAAKTRFSNTFAFLGRKREEGFRFYAMGSGVAQGFSNPAIDELINEEYTLDELKTCTAERYEYKGYEVLSFTLPRHTLSFANGEWFYQDSSIDGTTSPWRAKGISHAYGKYLCGDRIEGRVGTIDPANGEYGQDFEFELQTFARTERNAFFKVAKLELDCLVGVSDTEEKIGAAISRDGQRFGDFFYKSLGTTGDYSRLVRWQPPGGIGQFESFMGIRLRSTAKPNFSIESLSFE